MVNMRRAADRGWMRQHHGFDAQAIIALAKTMC
ncbi:transketolase [Raoultella ornithinolytica]|nr:transketolase [Raoultella ornithinolytica]